MYALQYAQYGGPEVLELQHDVPEPHAGPGQVRVAVVRETRLVEHAR